MLMRHSANQRVNSNALLARANVALRRERPATRENWYVRRESVGGSSLYFIWFRAFGCRFDRRGECTMCNYGMSPVFAEHRIISYVQRALAGIHSDHDDTIWLSPSGSMFDDGEVPSSVRSALFKLLARTPCRSVICEVRPEDVRPDRLREFRRDLAEKQTFLETGIESVSPWVLRYCLNKTISRDSVLHMIDQAALAGVRTIANVLVGVPFLTPDELVDDAVAAASWALENGFDQVVLFPVHVKAHTLVGWLWRNGYYHPPSLWALVEVLRRLGVGLVSRVSVSWHRNYTKRSPNDAVELDGESRRRGEGDDYVLMSPTTCDGCEKLMASLLDRFKDRPSWAAVTDFNRIHCSCRENWERLMNTQPVSSSDERIQHLYDAIAAEFVGEPWWGHRREALLRTMRHERHLDIAGTVINGAA